MWNVIIRQNLQRNLSAHIPDSIHLREKTKSLQPNDSPITHSVGFVKPAPKLLALEMNNAVSIKSQLTLFFIIVSHKFSYRQINCFITSRWCIYVMNRTLTLYIPVVFCLVFFALFFIIPLQRLIISIEMSSQFCALPPTSADAHCFTSPAVSFTLCVRAWFPPNYHYTSGHATTMQIKCHLNGGILRWHLLQLVASVVLELWLSQRQQFVICKC